MKVKFFVSEKRREHDLATAVCSGFRRMGDQAELDAKAANPSLRGLDVACMVGVKSRKLFRDCLDAGVLPIMFDKGYMRHRAVESRVWEYWRVAIGAHHPTALLAGKGDGKRRRQIIGHPKNWRGDGMHILLAGSSAKYHDFYGLPEPTAWAESVIAELRQHTERPIVYRPKPSWDGAVPIAGTHFSGPRQNLDVALGNAWAVVTHGSNLCFEAAMQGIPTVVLGDAVARPISSTSLADIEAPLLAERGPWLDQLSQWQWAEREFARGEAMAFLHPIIEGMVAGRIPWPMRTI